MYMCVYNLARGRRDICDHTYVARLARRESEQDSEHKMPRLTMESRRRVLVLRSIGMSVTEIQKRLKEEEIEVS